MNEDPEVPIDAPEADVADETRREPKPEIPPDASEADVLDQARSWTGEEPDKPNPEIPPDAPEADVLDQARPVDLDDERRDE